MQLFCTDWDNKEKILAGEVIVKYKISINVRHYRLHWIYFKDIVKDFFEINLLCTPIAIIYNLLGFGNLCFYLLIFGNIKYFFNVVQSIVEIKIVNKEKDYENNKY